mgnify:CR=1 FL=1
MKISLDKFSIYCEFLRMKKTLAILGGAGAIGRALTLNAIVNDSTLTTGAHFGFGHWNAGQGNRGRRVVPFGGAWCHNNNTNCEYYRGWSGNHPQGQSVECTRNSCLKKIQFFLSYKIDTII